MKLNLSKLHIWKQVGSTNSCHKSYNFKSGANKVPNSTPHRGGERIKPEEGLGKENKGFSLENREIFKNIVEYEFEAMKRQRKYGVMQEY